MSDGHAYPVREPLFGRAPDGRWIPSPLTRGPFAGVQGGASAALLCALAEEAAEPSFQTSSIAVQFIAGLRFEPVEATVAPVRVGRRVAVVDAALGSGAATLVRATVTLTSAIDVPAVPDVAAERTDPGGFPVRTPRSPHGEPWLMDLMEARADPAGGVWFRFDHPVTGTESAFARVLACADWVSGISRPDSWDAPIVRGLPNVDLAVHLHREPVSPWIGLSPGARWHRRGTGLAQARIHDVDGEIGTAAATVVLMP